jgi:hypothetical protein
LERKKKINYALKRKRKGLPVRRKRVMCWIRDGSWDGWDGDPGRQPGHPSIIRYPLF